MKVYLICPVRNVTEEQQIEIDTYAKQLENNGIIVHNPKYDAPQDDPTGFIICETHLNAMKNSDEVHVFWDVSSKGSHFDLGMAFALNKKVIIAKLYQDDNVGKSYVKVMQQM